MGVEMGPLAHPKPLAHLSPCGMEFNQNADTGADFRDVFEPGRGRVRSSVLRSSPRMRRQPKQAGAGVCVRLSVCFTPGRCGRGASKQTVYMRSHKGGW